MVLSKCIVNKLKGILVFLLTIIITVNCYYVLRWGSLVYEARKSFDIKALEKITNQNVVLGTKSTELSKLISYCTPSFFARIPIV